MGQTLIINFYPSAMDLGCLQVIRLLFLLCRLGPWSSRFLSHSLNLRLGKKK